MHGVRSNGDQLHELVLLRVRQRLNVHEALIITGFHSYVHAKGSKYLKDYLQLLCQLPEKMTILAVNPSDNLRSYLCNSRQFSHCIVRWTIIDARLVISSCSAFVGSCPFAK